ncbi:dihydrolipoyl dehydrogenase family protein [Roseivivax sediminis]|uniref:Pyruvate/2-oxoglutarate dehydrogenase complex, dihydrolipoamide dehydrogenase (E3) component n=1 Tax=Roseivivax sediminis TaxID=936889 RepID=A0A1I2B8U6_9RHOB|nr:FAD-dependent oxidoreductase [Roseivivax sediminis]SFE51733.1 Pyruvate/2-oxoglutarate dehydrogenase complex, dihydrolipoamide dehydrogenase (E3) component [Roseivivax sediminis]
MERISTDLLVIGAGSGGLSVAAGASQMGANVVLLERGEMGGDCLNYGCVPSKALIRSAKTAHAMRHAARYGIGSVEPSVDYAAAKDHVQEVIASIAPHDSQGRFEGLGVRVIRETGRFVSETEVEAGAHLIRARRIVLATGSSPMVPPIPGLDAVPYLTNETLWDLRELPEHLLIIGGGPIGMEMAQTHRRLGSRVTVIEGAKALGKDDPELAEVALDAIRGEGVEIVEGAQAAEVRGTAGAIEVETGDGRVFAGSHLLLAVGRRANVDDLNLTRAGIETTKTGVKVDARLKTTNRRVYAIGDVAGGLQFTHVASYHAGLVVRSAVLGLPAKASTDHLPWATYTDPELANVGLTEAQAKERFGDKVEVARFDYDGNDRAQADRLTTGRVKVVVHRGRPVGAAIVGHQAGEHIGLWAFAISSKAKMQNVAGMVAPYPTYSELNKRAAGAYFSPRLFDSGAVKRVVRTVQRWLP